MMYLMLMFVLACNCVILRWLEWSEKQKCMLSEELYKHYSVISTLLLYCGSEKLKVSL